MGATEREAAEELNDHLDALTSTMATRKHDTIDNVISTFLEIQRWYDEPCVDSIFIEDLWSRLSREVKEPISSELESLKRAQHRRSSTEKGQRNLIKYVCAVAAMLFIAIAAITSWALRPSPVNAQDLVRRAEVALTSPTQYGVTSFSLVEEIDPIAIMIPPQATPGTTLKEPPGVQVISFNARSEVKESYEAPNRWRLELNAPIVNNIAQPTAIASWIDNISVSDGNNVWTYSQPAAGTGPTITGPVSSIGAIAYVHPLGADEHPPIPSAFGEEITSLSQLLVAGPGCDKGKVSGSGTVAGRTAYVVEFDVSHCGSGGQQATARRVLWVDKQTFFVLKDIRYSSNGAVFSETDVTSIRYNVPFDSSYFTFTPPPGVEVHSSPPGPNGLPAGTATPSSR